MLAMHCEHTLSCATKTISCHCTCITTNASTCSFCSQPGGASPLCVATMSSPDQLASELADIPGLLDAQTAAGLDREEVIESLYRSWTARLSNLGKFSDKGKTVITQAISAGPWSESQVKDLASIILHGKKSPSNSSKASNRRSNQKCLHFENFIPMSTIIKLRDSSKYSQLSRASMLAATARSIGIELPDLPTLFRMTAIIAYLEGNYDYSQKDVFKVMNAVQNFIKSVSRHDSLPFIEFYPVEVSGLPEPIRTHAYTQDDLPVVVDWPELSTVLGSNKMKGGKDENKGSKLPAWLEHVPPEHKGAVLNAVQVKGKQACSSNEPQPREEPQGHQSPPPLPWYSSKHTADVFRFAPQPTAPSQTAAAAQAADKDAEAGDTEDTWGDDEDDEEHKGAEAGGIENMENDMFAILKGRKTKGKPAACPKVLKKPAGKPTPMKKPAAAKTDAWKLLHSRIWSRTRKKEFDKHGDDDRAKQKASSDCKKARVKFLAGELDDF
jgi:hypothetical protein